MSNRDWPTTPDQFSYPNMRAETTLPHSSSSASFCEWPAPMVQELQRAVQSPSAAVVAPAPSPKRHVVTLADPTYQARQITLNEISAFEQRCGLH